MLIWSPFWTGSPLLSSFAILIVLSMSALPWEKSFLLIQLWPRVKNFFFFLLNIAVILALFFVDWFCGLRIQFGTFIYLCKQPRAKQTTVCPVGTVTNLRKFIPTYFPWWGKWQPTPVFLPEKSHGQRSLVGCSSWGCRVRQDWMTKHKCTHWLSHQVSFLKLWIPCRDLHIAGTLHLLNH